MTPVLVLAGGLMCVAHPLPASWDGVWTGVLTITSMEHGKVSDDQPMTLTITRPKPLRVGWTVEKYKEQRAIKQVGELIVEYKPASLIFVEKGNWQMRAMFTKDRLSLVYSTRPAGFGNGRQTLWTERYERTGDTIRYELTHFEQQHDFVTPRNWSEYGVSFLPSGSETAELRRKAK